MEINVKQKVNVPVSPWCGNCYRNETDKHGQHFCSLFSRFIYIKNGHWLKCRECYIALYDQIERDG